MTWHDGRCPMLKSIEQALFTEKTCIRLLILTKSFYGSRLLGDMAGYCFQGLNPPAWPLYLRPSTMNTSPSWTSLPAVQIGKVSDCWFCSWTMRGNGEEWEEGERRGWMTTSTLNFGWDFQNELEVHRPKCFHRRNGSESGRRQIGWSTLMQGNVCCRAIGRR